MGFHKRILTILFTIVTVQVNYSQSQLRSTDIEWLGMLEKRITEEIDKNHVEKALEYSNEGLEIILKGPYMEYTIKSIRAKFYYLRGRCDGKKGDDEKAIEDFNLAVQSDANNHEIFFWRGISKMKLGNYSESLKDFSTSIESQYETANSYYYRARVNFVLDSLDASISDYMEAVTLGRNDTSTCFELAGSYLRRGDLHLSEENYTQASDDFRSALRWRPRFSTAYFHQSLATIYRGNIQEAGFILDTVLTLDPTNYIAHEFAGYCDLSCGKLSSADHHFRCCLQIDSTNWNASLGLAATFLAKEDTVNCLKYRHRVLQIEPRLANGVKKLSEYNESSSYLFFVRSQPVKSLFEKVIAQPRKFHN